MKIGLVGLPNAGKSTLFNALTKIGAPVADYPFTTIEPNVGFVTVPDDRFEKVVELIEPKKTVPAVMRFVDIAGLVKGASQGEGLGNQFLGHIREVDAIVHVVRCFDTHGPREADDSPGSDIEIINFELALADLATCENRVKRLAKPAKSGDKESIVLLEELNKLIEELSLGHLASNFPGIERFADLCLLTAKPMIFAANISEDELRADQTGGAAEVKKYAESHGCDHIVISAKVEAELADLDEDDREEFRTEMGIDESSQNHFIKVAYHTLGLMSFFTAGPEEVRAWTVKQKATAVEAAGVIHTDFATGFIKAEVIGYSELLDAGSFSAARDLGRLRLEGKNYLVQDGDVMHFKFNC